MNSKGFTAVELMIVLAIAGILLGIATTSTSVVSQKTKFESQKTQLRDLIQQARNFARGKNQCVSLTIQGQVVTATGFGVVGPVTSNPCVVAPYSSPPYGTPAVFASPAPSPAPSIDATSTLTYTFDPSTVITPFTAGGYTINPVIFNTNGGTDYGVTISTSVSAFGFTGTLQVLPLIGQIEEY